MRITVDTVHEPYAEALQRLRSAYEDEDLLLAHGSIPLPPAYAGKFVLEPLPAACHARPPTAGAPRTPTV